MKDYKNIEHLRNLNDSLIWERMKRCYDYGYEDRQSEYPVDGRNEIWEILQKITEDEREGGYPIKMLNELFGSIHVYNIVHDYTPQEVIDKIKEYEDKQKCKECKKTKDPIFYGHCVGECDYVKQTEDEIKVGDEIVCEDAHVVITYISPSNKWNGFLLNDCENGERGQGYTLMDGFKGWEKTSRHFDQIAEVLAELRGAE